MNQRLFDEKQSTTLAFHQERLGIRSIHGDVSLVYLELARD